MNALCHSFGMLLWELAFQKFPYKDWEVSQIQEHVLKGGRETLNSSLTVEKKFGKIIKAGMVFLSKINLINLF